MKRVLTIIATVLILACPDVVFGQMHDKKVFGIVVDKETGAGLGGAEVSIVGGTETVVTTTDGTFSIFVPKESNCQIRVRLANYAVIDNMPIGIENNAFMQKIELSKEYTQCISGRVVDGQGQGIPKVEVTLVSGKPTIVYTDSNGVFCIKSLDITQLRITARKRGFGNLGVITLDVNPALATKEIELHPTDPPKGPSIQVLEESPVQGKNRGPIPGVQAYVNDLPSNTGEYGISSEKGYIIVSAGPGERITLVKDGYESERFTMPAKSAVVVLMKPTCKHEEERFVRADLAVRTIVGRLYAASEAPGKKGTPNLPFESLLDSFKVAYNMIANFGYMCNDSLIKVRKDQYYGPNGPFRKLNEYINNRVAGSEKWKAMRLLRNSLLDSLKKNEDALSKISLTMDSRGDHPEVYNKIPELLNQAYDICQSMIGITKRLRDEAGMDVGDAIQRNAVNFNQAMDTATTIFQKELADNPALRNQIRKETEEAKSIINILAKG